MLLTPSESHDFDFPSTRSFPIHIAMEHRYHPGPLFQRHWHEQLQFLYFTEGTAVIHCNSVPLYATPGHVIVLNPNDIHYGENTSHDLIYWIIKLDWSFLDSSQVDICQTRYITPLSQNRIIFQNLIPADSPLHRCMDIIINESRQQQIGFELSIKAALYQIFAILLRNYTEKTMPEKEYHTQIGSLYRLRPVLEYVEKNFTDHLSIDQLSKMAGVSEHHFCRLFKKTTGQSAGSYINRLRLNKAMTLLKESDETITQIALTSGFNDINYFSRLFKEHAGQSPSQFRKKE